MVQVNITHGVATYEVPTKILTPDRMSAAIPFIVGTAPVHRATAGSTNEVKLIYSLAEATAYLGDDADFSKWTLMEAVDVYFRLYGCAPMTVVNVFDPTVHKTTVVDEAAQFSSAGTLTTTNADVLDGTIVIKSSDGNTTYTLDTDYEFVELTGVATRITDGAIATEESVLVSYEYADPSKVTSADIIGGADGETGKLTGLELIEQVFPQYDVVPGIILAPGWSQDPTVAYAMTGKCEAINSVFYAITVVDIPDATVTKYADVPAYKSTNSLTDPNMVVCWPRVQVVGDDSTQTYYLSTHIAAMMADVDYDYGDIPYASPSNKRLQINAAVANGQPVWLTQATANYLNDHGIVTALNWREWRSWGNKTACYPGNKDVKDFWISVRRFFVWYKNRFVLTHFNQVDAPMTPRLIERILSTERIFLNGLERMEAILGGDILFVPEDNPPTDLMAGILTFHAPITPPPAAERIVCKMQYDPSNLVNLFTNN